MADMTIEAPNLADLRRRASDLASAVDSLAHLFEEGANFLGREDQVARLKEFHSAILQRIERLREGEMAASTVHGVAGVIGSLVWLGAGLITMTSED